MGKSSYSSEFLENISQDDNISLKLDCDVWIWRA